MLTRREQDILDIITRYISREGYGPTLQEIAKAAGIKSKGTVHRYVQSLIRKKYLRNTGQGWRNVSLSSKNQKHLAKLPLEGSIVAGKTIEKVTGQSEVNFSEMLMGPDRFVLKVVGNSMVEVGILDGDMIVVRKSESAEDGDIVVALIDNEEITLKRMRSHGDRIELLPDNPSLTPMIYPTGRVHIKGVVVGQVRLY